MLRVPWSSQAHCPGEDDKAALFLNLGDLVQLAGNLVFPPDPPSSGSLPPRGLVFLSPLTEM